MPSSISTRHSPSWHEAEGLDLGFDRHNGSSRSGRRWVPTAAQFRPADARGSRPRRPSCWSTGRWRTRSPVRHSRRLATGAPMAPSTTAASATGKGPLPPAAYRRSRECRCPLRARARHPPGRDERPRRAPPARLGADRPRRGGRHATPVPGLRAAVVGRVRLGQGGLRRVVMRLVQRPQPLLSGLGPAGPAPDTGFSRYVPTGEGLIAF